MPHALLISCVVPVYNGERFVADAVKSILAQSYRPIEIIVVNDGSTDRTADVLAEFGEQITVTHQENAGQAAARNNGIQTATGNFIAFLDADDLWEPEKLERQMSWLAEHPELQICTCLMQNFWAPELADEAEAMRDTQHARPFVATWQGVLAKREVFDTVGRIDTGAAYADVREWMHRARTLGVNVGRIDEVLVRRRIHGANISRGRAQLEPELLLRLAERAMARRRNKDPEG